MTQQKAECEQHSRQDVLANFGALLQSPDAEKIGVGGLLLLARIAHIKRIGREVILSDLVASDGHASVPTVYRRAKHLLNLDLIAVERIPGDRAKRVDLTEAGRGWIEGAAQ